MMTIRQVYNYFISICKKKLYAKDISLYVNVLQGLAILLSCLIYHHEITVVGVFGILLVFGSVFLRIYCNNRLRAIRRRRAAANSIKY